jgi:hypothetical protein
MPNRRQLMHRIAIAAANMARTLDDDEKILVKGDHTNAQVSRPSSLRARNDQGVWYLTCGSVTCRRRSFASTQLWLAVYSRRTPETGLSLNPGSH